LVSGSYP